MYAVQRRTYLEYIPLSKLSSDLLEDFVNGTNTGVGIGGLLGPLSVGEKVSSEFDKASSVEVKQCSSADSCISPFLYFRLRFLVIFAASLARLVDFLSTGRESRFLFLVLCFSF